MSVVGEVVRANIAGGSHSDLRAKERRLQDDISSAASKLDIAIRKLDAASKRDDEAKRKHEEAIKTENERHAKEMATEHLRHEAVVERHAQRVELALASIVAANKDAHKKALISLDEANKNTKKIVRGFTADTRHESGVSNRWAICTGALGLTISIPVLSLTGADLTTWVGAISIVGTVTGLQAYFGREIYPWLARCCGCLCPARVEYVELSLANDDLEAQMKSSNDLVSPIALPSPIMATKTADAKNIGEAKARLEHARIAEPAALYIATETPLSPPSSPSPEPLLPTQTLLLSAAGASTAAVVAIAGTATPPTKANVLNIGTPSLTRKVASPRPGSNGSTSRTAATVEAASSAGRPNKLKRTTLTKS